MMVKRAGFGVRLAKVLYPRPIVSKLWVLNKIVFSTSVSQSEKWG